mmetsp:Transcript_30780/g.70914  ORF Transcript_30780/g.70914 Transcript_30780/m.70914 type:complete len:93 (-) Transcript_30780:224-502(-)
MPTSFDIPEAMWNMPIGPAMSRCHGACGDVSSGLYNVVVHVELPRSDKNECYCSNHWRFDSINHRKKVDNLMAKISLPCTTSMFSTRLISLW